MPISERLMANTFGTDILIQAEDPMEAADFYVKELGFEITDKKSNMISLHGKNINFFIERGPALGPVFEVTVKSVKEAKARLKKKGCQIVKDEPDFPRCYVKDPNGLIYNLTE
jgi:predicted enzyme related to lactoylglutathione lyase